MPDSRTADLDAFTGDHVHRGHAINEQFHPDLETPLLAPSSGVLPQRDLPGVGAPSTSSAPRSTLRDESTSQKYSGHVSNGLVKPGLGAVVRSGALVDGSGDADDGEDADYERNPGLCWHGPSSFRVVGSKGGALARCAAPSDISSKFRHVAGLWRGPNVAQCAEALRVNAVALEQVRFRSVPVGIDREFRPAGHTPTRTPSEATWVHRMVR